MGKVVSLPLSRGLIHGKALMYPKQEGKKRGAGMSTKISGASGKFGELKQK